MTITIHKTELNGATTRLWSVFSVRPMFALD